MTATRYRALWPMEWHRRLLICVAFGVLAVAGCVFALLSCAWVLAGALALLAPIPIEQVTRCRVYWRWVIQCDDRGVTQTGALASSTYRATVPWDAVTTWQRQRLTGRGRPKVRGEHVYRYTLGDGSGPAVAWQSNYFPRSRDLVDTLVAKLGDPKEIPRS